MKEKILNAYQPPAHFAKVEQLPSVVQEAANDNTELWLIRFPANEIGPTDLLEKKVNLKVDGRDGVVGHFYNSQGEEYNIVNQGKVDTLQPYAFIPNSVDPLVVRRIACQVGFVKTRKVKNSTEQNSHHQSGDGGVAEHEQTTSGVTSEKEQSALLDVEKPSKKKRSHSKMSEK